MRSRRIVTPPPRVRRNASGMVRASVLIGVGLGGLFDGIALHQILQWHHMLSSPVPPITVDALELNTLADGLFHAAAWVATGVGIAWLIAAARPDRPSGGTALLGGVLTGWGAFNVVEGIVDHHLLGIHHVRTGEFQMWWDVGFLVLGVLLMIVGWLLQRGGREYVEPAPRAVRR